MVRTVTAIFDRLGLDYVAVGGPTYCCGIVHHRQGDTAAGEGMANRTIELFERYAPDEVVMWCPSCIYFYDEVKHAQVPFPCDTPRSSSSRSCPRMTFTARVERTVALHAHGVGEARLREARAGRELLAAVPGVRVVPLEPEPRFGRSARRPCRSSSARTCGTGWSATRSSAPAPPARTRWPDLSRLPAADLRLRGGGAHHHRALSVGLRARPRHRVRGPVQEVSTLGRSRPRARGHGALPAGERCRPREGPRAGDGDVCAPLRPRRGRHRVLRLFG